MRHSRNANEPTISHGRSAVLLDVAGRIVAIQSDGPIRVAIDGVDCAGKTTFANELASMIQSGGRPVIRASIDGFHNPRETRYRNGDNPRAYFNDSFDYDSLQETLLAPLGPSGSLRYRTAVFDYRVNAVVAQPLARAPNNAVLLFDGVFLLRAHLRPHWDYTIFIHVPFDVVIHRASHRDAEMFGGAKETRARYLSKYIPGELLYLNDSKPHLIADLVIDNRDLSQPKIATADDRECLLDESLRYSHP